MRCWKVIESIRCELAQNQIIEALRRQVETSNNAARDAQAFLRTTQEQQKHNIRTVVPLATIPSSSIHQRGYVQESFMVRDITMYGREEVDPPRRDPQTSGSSSQGSSFQSSQRAVGRAGRVRNAPAFPGSRIVPTRRIGSRDIAYQRVIKFGTTKVPKLTKSTLVNTEVHRLIQYIQLLRHEAFDNETITLLEYIFHPTETASRHPVINHWTLD